MPKDINSSISIVSHIHSLSADFLQKELSSRGLKEMVSSHGNILFKLSRVKQMSMGELSQEINRDKSTTTVLVRKLEKEGLVTVQKDPADNRGRLISLTEKGCRYNDCTGEISRELIETFYKGFTQEEKEQFFNLLHKIEKNFE